MCDPLKENLDTQSAACLLIHAKYNFGILFQGNFKMTKNNYCKSQKQNGFKTKLKQVIYNELNFKGI